MAILLLIMSASAFASLAMSMYMPNDDEDMSKFGELDPKYLCIICRKLLREPKQTECGHRLCGPCLDKKLEHCNEDSGAAAGAACAELKPSFMCPVNEEDCVIITEDNINPDFSIIREINNLEVKCLYENSGCTVEKRGRLKLRNYKDHIATCKYKVFNCRYCPTYIGLESEVLEHEETCDMRPVICKDCHENVPMQDTQRHTTICTAGVVSCHCGATMKRSELTEHAKICNSVCAFCHEQNTPSHKSDNIVNHLDSVLLSVTKLDLKVAQFRSEVIAVDDEKTELMETMSRNDHDIKKIQTDFKEYQEQMAKKILELTEEIEKVKMLVLSIDDSANIANAANAVPATIIADMRALKLKLDYMEAGSKNGVLVWKITEYRRRKQEEIDRKINSFYSPAFLTSDFGYKLCLRVYFNGDGIGRDKYISVYLVIMKGNNDDELEWPFNMKCAVSLLNRKDLKKSYTENFITLGDGTTDAIYGKPKMELNTPFGAPQFLSHEELENYLVDDSLSIKCVVTEKSLM